MAFDAMNNAYATDEVRDLIEGRLRAEWDENTRLKYARLQGEASGKAEAARRMAQLGIDSETIYEVTGLRPDENLADGI